MTKKKRFGISAAMTRGLTETINVVENNAGVYRNVILPLSRIELDPENPRKLAIDLSDVRHGLRPDDPQYTQKSAELERLKELSHTIKSSGVINPIVVYKNGECYRVVAGERRCLASILASKQEIEARVFNEKPKGFDLKLIQWIENTAREDLSLSERLGNMREIIKEYVNQNGEVEVTATLLKNITGLSLPQTSFYMTVLNAPKDVHHQIEQGGVRSLDKAALLASIESAAVREQAIAACIGGASLKELRNIISQQKTLTKATKALQLPARGRAAKRVNMGTTLKTEVVKAIVDSVVTTKQFDKHADLFAKVNWTDLSQATKAFRKLIEILELEIAV